MLVGTVSASIDLRADEGLIIELSEHSSRPHVFPK
jgi:hypothetical protein